MPKPPRTAEQLQAMLLERIEAIPELRGQPTDIHRADIARIIRTLQGQFDLED